MPARSPVAKGRAAGRVSPPGRAGRGPGRRPGGDPGLGRQRHVGVQPGLEVAVRSGRTGVVALQRPAVEREEQPLEVRLAPGRRRRPTSGAPSRRWHPRRAVATAAKQSGSSPRPRWTTADSRPSLEPKWYRSMRWLVPTASAMRRRLWSARPSALKCSITASSRRSRDPSPGLAWHVPNGTFDGADDEGGSHGCSR